MIIRYLIENESDTILNNLNDTIVLKSQQLNDINYTLSKLSEEIILSNQKSEPTFYGAKYDTVYTVSINLSSINQNKVI